MVNYKNSWNRWKEQLAFIILVILAYKLINNLYPIWQGISRFFGIISPFVVGFVIAYFLNPPCSRLRELLSRSKNRFLSKRAHGFSVLGMYVFILVTIVLVLNYIFPIITKNILELLGLIPLYYKNIVDLINNLEPDSFLMSFGWKSIITSFSIQDVISRLSIGVGSISGYAVLMTSGIVNIFLSTIISVYMLLYKESLLALVDKLSKVFIRENSLKTIKVYLSKINEIFYMFVSTQFLDACILGTLATILLSVLGVRYAPTLGLLLGVCNMIPYFGSIFASSVAIVITLFSGGARLGLITGISLLILQQIDGNIIGPKLMGNSLSLNPIWIIFSITLGGSYLGVLGMFLSVPAAAMLKFIFNELIEAREKRKLELAKE